MDKKNITFNILILVIFALLTLNSVVHHEIWIDEAQAWLIARDMGFFDMIKYIRIEGHPILWYVLIFPLAKLKLSVLSMQILNWLLVLVGAVFFVFKSPFNKLCKVTFLMSAGMIYWFPVFARNYCFIPILIFLLATFYPQRKAHPYIYALILILLANTHVIIFAFAAAMVLLYLFEDVYIPWKNVKFKEITPNLICAGLMCLNLLIITLYLYGTQNTNAIVSGYSATFQQVFVEYTINTFGSFRPELLIILAILMSVLTGFIFKYSKKMFFVFALTALYQFGIYKFIWGVLPQRAFSLILVIIFCFWIILSENFSEKRCRLISILLSVYFIITIPSAFLNTIKDWFLYYSDGKNTAEYIKQNISEDSIIVTIGDNDYWSTSAILVHLPKRKFWSMNKSTYYTFGTWQQKTGNEKKDIIVSSPPLSDPNIPVYIIACADKYLINLEPVYASNKEFNINQGETYRIYKAP